MWTLSAFGQLGFDNVVAVFVSSQNAQEVVKSALVSEVEVRI